MNLKAITEIKCYEIPYITKLKYIYGSPGSS
jgi:hypothetical protein